MYRKGQSQLEKKRPTSKVGLAEAENLCKDWNREKISVHIRNRVRDRSLHEQARYPFATTAAGFLESEANLTDSENDGHLSLGVAGLEQQRRDEGEGHRGRDLETGHHEVDQNQVEFAHPENEEVL